MARLPANVVPQDLLALICEPDSPLTRPLVTHARGTFGAAAERFVEEQLARERSLDRS